MKNPIKQIVDNAGKNASTVLEGDLQGVVSNTTFYNLIDERGIPSKAQWGTIERVVRTLGYEIIFQKIGKSA